MKTLKERIEIESAGSDGKNIEVDIGYTGEWEKFHNPDEPDTIYLWREDDYRIKPEPRVIYVNEYKLHGISNQWHTTQEGAIDHANGSGITISRVIKFIEDLED